jgi:hypothetical protein
MGIAAWAAVSLHDILECTVVKAGALQVTLLRFAN